MYQLFTHITPTNPAIVKYAQWRYVRDGMRREIGKVLSFYRKNPKAVKSDHFLVRLVQSLNVPLHAPIDRYYTLLDAKAMNLSMALGMTSSIYRGKTFRGTFYNKECPEVLIASNDSLDPFEAHRNWKNLIPVRVLRHPNSSLSLPILKGQYQDYESGPVVVSIDIPLLGIMYRAFRLNEEYLAEGGAETQKTAMQFIHMYVLPNMIQSHLEVAIINRLSKMAKNETPAPFVNNHSFVLVDYTDKADAVLAKINELFEKVTYLFPTMLKTIPSFIHDSIEPSLVLPDMAPTQQVNWALALSRLNVLDYLCTVAKDGPVKANSHQVNLIRKEAARMHIGKMFDERLDRHDAYDANVELANLLEKLV